ncbi:MAG TPA: adenylate/guanylate cyclase domain-containing protein [Gaiellales bacterium]|nr:adenylate/guanylate cyclase domain-containing protein [Gaiellales bacterium]
MNCPSCAAPNADTAKFCTECGTALEAHCPACGTAHRPGQRFCAECGAALAAVAVAAPDAAGSIAQGGEVAERRLVTVLFADLVGFTTLSEHRDAEEVRELLSRYFATCRRLIGLYGGTVEKFIGDAVMAVWGTPTATEDDAERAVRAALDLVAAVSSLGEEVAAEGLRARAGVLTGEAAVTVGAQGEGMVAGDLVNTASRIQSVAEPGAVFVGDSTRRTTEQTIVYEPAGSFELKGKDGLVTLWRAMRVVSGARGALKSEGLEAPFVGRDRELRLIKDLFHASAEEQSAHLVSVTGVAGIGKSRLAWEFYKYFDGLAEIIYWHRGRCLAYGEGVTYWALADMVRMRCRIGEDESAESALAKLRTTLEEHILDDDERRFVEPRLGQLVALGDQEARDRKELFAAWRLFFERLSEAYPAVLVFEDMQWADASLLDFIEELLDLSRSHPIYVVTLARPELIERRPTWGAGLRNFTSLYLEPLAPAAMQDLLLGLVPGLPAALREQILARAEGIPLYAVETVRMLLDRGDLVLEGSAYRPVGEIGSLEVPETLHALIAARLDGLPGEERSLLQDGAVLGKTFPKAAIAALTGRDEAELEPLLASLVRKEVLGVQADPRSPEHGQYGFLQDLVRHVAYETLSRRDRKARHLAAARLVAEALGDEEVAEVVASHLLDAYRIAPDADDATEIRGQACEALVRAGDRAGSLGAAAEAQRYFEQAVELAQTPLAAAALADRAGQMAWLAGDAVRARALYDDAMAGYESAGEARPAARVSARLAELDFVDGRPGDAVARLEPVLESLAGEESPETAQVAAQLGRFLILDGEFGRGGPHIERALSLAEQLDLPETLAEALTSKGVLLMQVDRLYEARVLLEGAIEIAVANDAYASALRAINNLGVVLESLDMFGVSEGRIAEGVALARRIGNRQWEASLMGGTVLELSMLGRWDEASAMAAEAAELASTSWHQALLLELVRIHCERGEPGEARAVLDGASATDESGDAQTRVGRGTITAHLLCAEGMLEPAIETAEHVFGDARAAFSPTSSLFKAAYEEVLECAMAAGRPERAAELLAILDRLRPGQVTPQLRAIRSRYWGRLAAATGDDGAAESLAVAERYYAEIGMRFHAAATRLERAEILAAQGQVEEAETLIPAARDVFAELKARPWLARAEALQERTGSDPVLSA